MAIISRQRLHWYAPIVGATALLTTLATCFIITRVKGIYVGGLSWPFFSDMGREAPAYYVFITGLSIVAIALSIMWQLNGKFQRSVFTEETKPVFHWAVSIATAFGACSPIGLPILAVFDTSTYAMAHAITTAMFFLLQTLAVIINTVVSYHICSTAQQAHASVSPSDPEKLSMYQKHLASVRRTFRMQVTMCTLFAVSFIIYLPVGMSVVDKYVRLTIQQCLDKHLGEHYCTHTVRLDDVDTKLWNYEIGFALNQFRAFMQLACILTLLGYTALFITHDFDGVPSANAEAFERVVLSPVGAQNGNDGSLLPHDYERLDQTRTPSESETCMT